MPRAKPSRPTKRMRQAALAALHDAVTDDAVPPYAKVRAATALLGADRPQSRDSAWGEPDPDADESSWRPIFLPPKDGDSTVRYGKYYENQRVFVIPDGYAKEVQPEAFYAHVAKPAAIAARNRAEPLALPGPDEDDGE
jgi:hypothetical protein